jgi:L-alanine-DL-glutamate epimerase-like enolase superfamily enzyme
VGGGGYTALKFNPFRGNLNVLDGASLWRAVEAVAAVREAVGDSVDMLIECHGRFNAKSAARAAETLRPYGIYFMEGTVHPEDLEGLARFRSAARVPVALGERVANKGQLLQYIQYVDYIQVNLKRFGGPTEAR